MEYDSARTGAREYYFHSCYFFNTPNQSTQKLNQTHWFHVDKRKFLATSSKWMKYSQSKTYIIQIFAKYVFERFDTFNLISYLIPTDILTSIRCLSIFLHFNITFLERNIIFFDILLVFFKVDLCVISIHRLLKSIQS